MSILDLLSLILSNLGRRKARVALTAIGVVIGTAAVVILVSLAIGLQKNATERLYGIGDLTTINVMPTYGGGPMMPGVAVKVSGGGGSGDQPQQKLITEDSLTELAALPGVVTVIPRDYPQGGFMMKYNRLEGGANVIGIGVDDLSMLGLQASQGVLTIEKNSVVIGSMVSRNFYDPKARPGKEAPEPPDLFGQDLTVTLMRWDQQGNQTQKTTKLKVVGVLKETRGESDYSIYMPLKALTAYNEWFLGKRINRNKDGYNQVIVKAADPNQTLSLTETITGLGYQAYTAQQYLQPINSFFLIMQIIFGGVGAIALIVAAIGIANTMAMAILERTREIGLMKAVGATNRDVLSVFLGEAAGIGFIGGLGGVILGWSAGQIMNVLAIAYLAGQSAQQGGPPPTSAVATPAWLPIFALVFATLIGLLSGLYPALRAATLVPVTALKYE